MYIPHNRPSLGLEEMVAAQRVIKSGYLSQGKEVELFEKEICECIGYDAGHAIAVSSGSAALYMAIRSKMEITDVECIAIPAYSCSALENAVRLAGKKPVYLDVGIDTPNIDISGKYCADVTIACHLYGMPMEITDESVIEDCAQSIGATVKSNQVGSQTTISVFSFYATKPITSGGEGGMVVSKDKSVIEFLKDLRDFDMKHDDRVRFNFQMTDLQASIGREQLKKLNDFIIKRRYLADRYCDKGIALWNRKPGGTEYRGLVKSKNSQKLIKYLSDKYIGAIIPIEESELLCAKELVPRSFELTQSLVSIPLYPSLSEEEQDVVIEALEEYLFMEGEL